MKYFIYSELLHYYAVIIYYSQCYDLPWTHLVGIAYVPYILTAHIMLYSVHVRQYPCPNSISTGLQFDELILTTSDVITYKRATYTKAMSCLIVYSEEGRGGGGGEEFQI